jgi:ABC-type branched-subunit amino acid transport system permease subunit
MMEKNRIVQFLTLATLACAVLFPLVTGLNVYYLTVLILMVIFIIFASAWNFLTYSGQGSLGHAHSSGLVGTSQP